MDRLDRAISILADLVAFETLPGRPNLDFLDYIASRLHPLGAEIALIHDETGERANLYATIGPKLDGGVALSGHSDVVPVAGQAWTKPPFKLTRDGGKLYARGAVDMKGFIACCLAMAPEFAAADLRRPLHLALSYDEEPGSIGAPSLAEHIVTHGPRPAAVIVGEPTEMQIVAGHKGGHEFRTVFTGVAGHSSDPSRGVSAIHAAVDFVSFLVELAQNLAKDPDPSNMFWPPYDTLNVGTIKGGAGRSVIAEDCALDWELRVTPPSDGAATLSQIFEQLDHLERGLQAKFPQASIQTERVSNYPGLEPSLGSTALEVAQLMSRNTDSSVVAFGTDAGCFSRQGLPCAVMGPGSIEQAHIPDEYIEIDALRKCLHSLERLMAWLA